jgi:hypothetical protein
MRTIEQMKDNAQRQLDGMTTNRDQMAKDVLFLADTVKRLESLVKDAAADKQAREAAFGGFAKMFGGGL